MKIYIKTIIYFLLVFIYNNGFSQNETVNWYFGNKAGLNFSSGKPEPINNSAMNTYEGCSTISDSLGNLLFYTNGVNVWNRNHDIMQNGSGLFGDTSSTQSALIVPQPGNSNIYYVFTIDDIIHTSTGNITNGLRYSIVDMNSDNGLGAVTAQKNIVLRDSASEKISAIMPPDKSFVRIICHEWSNNNFISWKLTNSGLETVPVTVSIGTPHVQIEPDFILNGIGQMKCSSYGNKLALGLLRASVVEIFDLDIFSGNISNPIKIFFDFQAVYGVEFSPDESKLYVSADRKLFQFDLSSGDSLQIVNSLTEVYSSSLFISSLQKAIDGKIYSTNVNSEYLSVINSPDSIAAKCDYVHNAIYLDGKICRRGLPDFMQSYFIPSDIKYQNICKNDSTIFNIKNTTGIDSVYWDFGDINSGSLNFSYDINPTHIFSTAGTFSVNLKLWKSGTLTEIQRIIIIIDLPDIYLGNDTTFCSVDSALIGVNGNHLNILWSNNSTNDSIWVSLAGEYSLTAQNIYTGCINKDTLNTNFDLNPELNLGNDTSFCENTDFYIDAYGDSLSYIWNTGSENSFIIARNQGEYSVTVTNPNKCKSSDTINLKQILIPIFNLGNDTIICENTIFQIDIPLNNVDFTWQDQSSNSYYTIYEKGTYSLKAENICGFFEDSIYVDTKYCGDIIVPNIFTPEGDGINEVFFIKGIEEKGWELSIFSRWGDKVFYTKNYLNDWRADKLRSGVYFYILRNYSKNIELNGTVRVIKN